MKPLLGTAGMVLTAATLAIAAHGDTVKLRSEAYVKGPEITLGDLADIEGDNANSLSVVDIGNAATPGDSKRIDASLVKMRIEKAGIPTESLKIEGPDCVVAKTSHLDVTSDMLASDLRTFIESAMPWAPDEATVDIVAPNQEIVVPDGALEIRWWPNPQYHWVGSGVFRGEVHVDGDVKRTVLVRAQIEAYADVLVASTDIPRGSLISPADVQLEKRAMSQMKYGVLSNASDAVGQVARSTIFPGQVINKRQLMARQLIKRNQMVTVEARAGGLVIRSQARALMNGSEGDYVTCMNLESKEQFQGIVRKDGVVVVD